MHNGHRRSHTILPGRRIQPTYKCKQQRYPLLENKSNNGNSNPDNHHSIPDPIAAQHNPECFRARLGSNGPEETRACRVRYEQELSTKGATSKQLRAYCEIRLRSHEKEGRCHGTTKSTPSQEKSVEGQVAAGKAPAHDDVIKWKHFPRYWPFVRRIHRSPVNCPHQRQWQGALMFSLICVWINSWINY